MLVLFFIFKQCLDTQSFTVKKEMLFKLLIYITYADMHNIQVGALTWKNVQ